MSGSAGDDERRRSREGRDPVEEASIESFRPATRRPGFRNRRSSGQLL